MVGVLKAVGTGDLTVGDGGWLDSKICIKIHYKNNNSSSYFCFLNLIEHGC